MSQTRVRAYTYGALPLRPMRLTLFALFLIALVAVLLLTQPANVDNQVRLALPFTTTTWTGSVLAMVGGFFGAGVALGYLLGLPARIGAAGRARRAEKELAKAQAAGTEARVAAVEARASARTAGTEADEMQRLADEVARRTTGVVGDGPPRP